MYLVTQYLVGNCDASKRYRSTTLNDGIPICIYILAREIEYTFMHISHVLVIHASRKKNEKKQYTLGCPQIMITKHNRFS